MSIFRLGPGEYEYAAESSSENKSSRFLERCLFFSAALSLNPEAAEALAQLSATLPEVPPTALDDPEGLVAYLDRIAPSVETCCASLTIHDAWFVRFASFFVCVGRWHAEWGNYKPLFEGLDSLIEEAMRQGHRVPEQSLVVDAGSWDVLTASRQEFGQRFREQAELELKSYCDDRELQAQAAGMSRTPERRTLEPFYWLAGYQTRRWSCARIADVEGKDRTAVEKQVRTLASKIGLDLRPTENYDDAQTVSAIYAALEAAQQQLSTIEPFIEFSPALARVLPPVLRDLLS